MYLSKTGGIDFMHDFVLKTNAWDWIETVLSWPFKVLAWPVIYTVTIVNLVMFGGWLDIIPGERKQYDKAL